MLLHLRLLICHHAPVVSANSYVFYTELLSSKFIHFFLVVEIGSLFVILVLLATLPEH